MGVVKTSGITPFDVAALDSVQRASPFGPAPSAIVSPDGRVYLHWEFHREEAIACSTIERRARSCSTSPRRHLPVDPNPAPTLPGTPPSQERGAPAPGEHQRDPRRSARREPAGARILTVPLRLDDSARTRSRVRLT